MIYTANIARVGHTMIQVDMWDSGSHPVLLPITFCGKVTPLTIVPQDITVRFCFLNYPYSRSIDITNNSDIDGYFYFIQQQVTIIRIFELSSILNPKLFEAIIDGKKKKEILFSTLYRLYRNVLIFGASNAL